MFTFTVNGKDFSVDVPEDMPLLWVLRDHLSLVGTKYGCGVAQCGACTVHVDGAPVRSCQLTIGDIGDRQVVTIEELAIRPAAPPCSRPGWKPTFRNAVIARLAKSCPRQLY